VGLQYVVTEWKTQHPHAAAFSGTSRELLRVNMPYYPWYPGDNFQPAGQAGQ